LVGAPGVGKGTQTTRLLTKFSDLSSISSGDLLRENVRQRTPLGIKAESVMKSGNLVPDPLMIRLIVGELTKRGWIKSEAPALSLAYSSASSALSSAAMAQAEAELEFDDYVDPVGSRRAASMEDVSLPKREIADTPSASFILDGFPRTEGQARMLDREIEMNFVVNIDTPHDVVIERISNRLMHAPSGRIYNKTFNPPKVEGKDDVTGEPLTRRDDDDPEAFKQRLKKFVEKSSPLLEHYDKKGMLWTVKGNTSDEITPQLFNEVQRRFG
jgi:adenylate kinase